MENYKVPLSKQERAELQGIAGKGTHAASKVINVLILLNCDQAEGRAERPRTRDIAVMLCVSKRKVDRIKKTFVLQGLDLTLNCQPAKCEYDLKIDGRLEAQLLALSCSAPPEGQARWPLRLLADRLVELEYIYSRPYGRQESGGVHGRDAPPTHSRDPRAHCSGARPARAP